MNERVYIHNHTAACSFQWCSWATEKAPSQFSSQPIKDNRCAHSNRNHGFSLTFLTGAFFLMGAFSGAQDKEA